MPPPHSRRNLLLVSFDQWRGDWCDPFDKVVDLPNIERLAAEGWTARRCYTASPMCVPARFSWLTGLHPSEVGVTGHRIVDLKADAPSILRPLQQAGWHTELIGKSHLTAHTNGRDLRSEEPRLRQLGFDRVLEIGGPRALRTIDCALTDAWEAAGVRARLRDDLDRRYFDGRQPPAWEVRSTTLPTELYPDVWLGDQAVQCITELPGDRPWIAYVSFAGPHEPFDTPPPWAGRHASADLPEATPKPPWMRALPARSTTRRTCESWGDRVTAEATDACRRDYADHLQLLDDQLGALLTALERRTDAERTDVVVTADHGELLGDAGMLYKGAFLEGAVRVPWIHRPAPCVDGPRGESFAGPVGLTPLLAECMRHQTSDEGFHELVAAAERTSLVVSEYEDEVMVIAGPHKLVVNRKGRPLWATDLDNDPLEQENVITAHPREWDMAPCWRALRQHALQHFQNVRKRGFGWMRRRHIERVR